MRHRLFSKSFIGIIVLILSLYSISVANAQTSSINWNKIDPELRADIENSTRDNQMYRIIVVMTERYDQSVFERATRNMDKQTRREYVMGEMKRFTSESQSNVLGIMRNQNTDAVSNLQQFWIFNGFSCMATASVIETLSNRGDISMICSDKERQMIPDTEDAEYVPQRGNAWNVTKVNADDVWTYYGSTGYTGKGVVVAVIDTGVNYNHTDIKDNMWDGGSEYPYHGYDFVNSDNNPIDDHSHGTHCAGTVAGYGTNGTQTGMATGAKIMALKVLNSSGNGEDGPIVNAMEFAMEHGADIVSLSLGASGVGGYWYYRDTMVTLLNAGVVASVAAGNDGDELNKYPIPYNIGAPGNCPPPYLHPDQKDILDGGLSATISVGATDQNDVHTYFTSVGPATWSTGSYIGNYNDYPYSANSNTLIGLIRPDVAAPGYQIVSLTHNSNTGYCTKNGTSMATPCVAGVMALMLEANPDLTPRQIDSILEHTAVRCEGATSKSNYTGSGRIDAYAAVQGALSLPISFADANVKALCVANWDTNGDGELSYGEAAAVTDLGNVFKSNRNITSFNELQYFTGLTSIGENTFNYCRNLTSIVIPNNVVTIGYDAFYECDALAALDIPNSVTTIANSAFYGCISLTSLYIPASVTSIISLAFGHNNLEQIVVDPDNPVYDSRNNCNAIIKTATNEVLIGCKNTVFPNTVTSIGSYAFYHCDGLTLLEIPSTITSISKYAFEYNSIGQIVVDSENSVYDSRNNSNAVIKTATNELIVGCENTIIPNTITKIGEYAFYNCKGLTAIEIPNSVTIIDSYAFNGCSGLTTISIPSQVVQLGYNAFQYCSHLVEISVYAVTPPVTLGNYVFGGINKSIPVTVYCESVNEYYNANQWSDFTNYQTFEDDCPQEITVSMNIADGGTVTGGGTYNTGDTCTLVAVPNDGYLFTHWERNGNLVSCNSTYSFSVCGETEYVAIFDAIEGLYIGSGEAVSNSIPSYSSYKYSLSQQIYTSQEIGSGEIQSIAFFNAGNEKTRNFNIYLIPTNKNKFSSTTDWIPVTESDMVFSGDVTLVKGDWTVINLDTPRYFDGNSNLAFVIDDNTGLYGSGVQCRVLDADGNQTLRFASDNNNPDPYNPTRISGTLMSVKNQIILNIDHEDSFEVNVTKDIAEAGTVTGAGTYYYGATCTVTATANNGYTFRYWTDNGNFVSYDSEFSFEVRKTYNLQAVFSADSPIHFEDENVKTICVANWDTNSDGELSYNEAAAVTALGTVFKNNNSITSFNELEYFTGLTTIGSMAFRACEYLKSMTIPNNVTIIDSDAFAYCYRLATVDIPNSVTTINNGSFQYCYKITDLFIPSSVTTIGNNAFYNCYGLQQIVVDNNNPIYDSRDNCNAIIASNSNKLLYGSKNSIIPNSVTTIGNRAFYAIPIVSIVIPNSVNTIEDYAFSNCNKLESITIPNSVNNLGEYVFSSCYVLSYITVDETNEVYDSRDNCNAIIETATNKLMFGCKNTIIPNTVNSINNNAFYNMEGLTNIEIPNSVTEIGSNAFAYCYKLTSVDIANSVTTIHSSAFDYCYRLTSLIIPTSVVSIGQSAFYNCYGLTSITSQSVVPPTLEASWNGQYYVFYQVDKSIPLYVPRGAAEAYAAAPGWNEFTNIQEDWDLPISFADANVKALCVANWDTNGDGELSYNEAAAVTDLGGVFTSNQSIQTFDELQYFTGLNEIGEDAFAWCMNMTSVQLPNTITSIGSSAFYDCHKLHSITIPAAVNHIGSSALSCSNLETIVVESDNTTYDSRDNCNAIIETATNKLIRGCKNTIIPNTVVTLADNSFRSCYGMTYIEIPASVSNIVNGAFYACSLGCVVVDSGNLVYDSRNNCNAIIETASNKLIVGSQNAVIPDDVTVIGRYAFFYCLENGSYSITLPSVLSTIEYGAFYGCSGLSEITSLASTPPSVENKAFDYVNKSIPVYVPAGTVNAYKSAYGWSEFTNIREIGTHWSPISGTENNMIVNGIIKINNEQQYNPLLEVGAFCGDECRGSSFARLFPPTGEYVAQITIVSNATDGETINFRLYDHEIQAEPDVVCFNTIEFVADGEIGTYGGWYEYVFYGPDNIQNVNLVEGWNWWSTFIEQNGNNGLETLEDNLGHNGSVIKSQTQSVVNYYPQTDDDMWFGDLTSLENEQGYLVNTTAACEFIYAGVAVNPSEHPITLVPNWTWIGYPVNIEQYPAEAMSGFVPTQNDIVKGQNSFALYYDGWFPQDFVMIPGQSYKYQSKSDENRTLTFVNSGNRAEINRENRYWKSNEHAFADNMNIVATVTVAGVEQSDTDLELGAFVNGVCRGSAKLKYFEPLNRYYAMLTISGDKEEDVEFALVNAEQNKMGNSSDESLTFVSDAVVGTLTEPFEIHFGEMTDIDRSSLVIYPNPVDRNEMFTLDIPNDETIKEIVITDALGSVVCKNTFSLRVSGVYMVKAICASGNVYFGKLIVK